MKYMQVNNFINLALNGNLDNVVIKGFVPFHYNFTNSFINNRFIGLTVEPVEQIQTVDKNDTNTLGYYANNRMSKEKYLKHLESFKMSLNRMNKNIYIDEDDTLYIEYLDTQYFSPCNGIIIFTETGINETKLDLNPETINPIFSKLDIPGLSLNQALSFDGFVKAIKFAFPISDFTFGVAKRLFKDMFNISEKHNAGIVGNVQQPQYIPTIYDIFNNIDEISRMVDDLIYKSVGRPLQIHEVDQIINNKFDDYTLNVFYGSLLQNFGIREHKAKELLKFHSPVRNTYLNKRLENLGMTGHNRSTITIPLMIKTTGEYSSIQSLMGC